MSSEDAGPGYAAIAGPTWRNEITARAVLHEGRNRAIRDPRIGDCPILIQVAERDSIAPPARRRPPPGGPRAARRCASTPAPTSTSTSASIANARSPTSSTSCAATSPRPTHPPHPRRGATAPLRRFSVAPAASHGKPVFRWHVFSLALLELLVLASAALQLVLAGTALQGVLPASPKSLSLPLPPLRVSLPAPPQIVSLPAWPETLSLPPRAAITSAASAAELIAALGADDGCRLAIARRPCWRRGRGWRRGNELVSPDVGAGPSVRGSASMSAVPIRSTAAPALIVGEPTAWWKRPNAASGTAAQPSHFWPSRICDRGGTRAGLLELGCVIGVAQDRLCLGARIPCYRVEPRGHGPSAIVLAMRVCSDLGVQRPDLDRTASRVADSGDLCGCWRRRGPRRWRSPGGRCRW